ncbi:MAG: hypothetical protein GX663_03605 [Clostridiales bacterium]|nr:hypothetical protein [Clostridiales bacterium]
MGKSKKNIIQTMGITRTVIRPPEEMDIQVREDRIGKYFRKYLNKFAFVEFSESFMKENRAGSLMRGVPIPLRKKEIKDFAGGNGIPMLVIAENMAWVMGCDPHFKHIKDYVAILSRLYNYKIYEGMMKEGRDAAERGDLDNACIHFRASLCMKNDYMHGMYSYARACRALYLNSHNEEYVGRFKAEALDWFELLTETHPRFAQGYYYLGYAYLNIGMYAKADLAWQNFVRFSRSNKDKKEIRNRMGQIAEPVRIEEGYNNILAGRYEAGIDILEPFLSSKFNDWWPLYYYIGIGYEMTGDRAAAVDAFKKVLQLNGSHIDTMRELLKIYEDEDDKANIKKYSQKIELIEAAMEEERLQHEKETKREEKKLIEEEPKLAEPEHIEADESERDVEAGELKTGGESETEKGGGEGVEATAKPEKKRLVKSLKKK